MDQGPGATREQKEKESGPDWIQDSSTGLRVHAGAKHPTAQGQGVHLAGIWRLAETRTPMVLLQQGTDGPGWAERGFLSPWTGMRVLGEAIRSGIVYCCSQDVDIYSISGY